MFGLFGMSIGWFLVVVMKCWLYGYDGLGISILLLWLISVRYVSSSVVDVFVVMMICLGLIVRLYVCV